MISGGHLSQKGDVEVDTHADIFNYSVNYSSNLRKWLPMACFSKQYKESLKSNHILIKFFGLIDEIETLKKQYVLFTMWFVN